MGGGWHPASKLWEIQMSMSTYWKCANIRNQTFQKESIRDVITTDYQAWRLTRTTRRAHYPKETLLFISMKTRLQLIRGKHCF